MSKKYCKNCLRWYHMTKADQCNIPSCGITAENNDFNNAIGIKIKIDEIGLNFIKSHLSRVHYNINDKTIYGTPSLLNKNNDCYFYKALPTYLKWLTNIIQIFY